MKTENEKLRVKYLKRISRKTGQAISEFDMIQENDKIMVAISGGKDSWTLLHILQTMKKKAPIKFDLIAVKIDYPNTNQENERIKNYCLSIGINTEIIYTNINKIIRDNLNKKKSLCAFCARLRRGFLYTAYNKFAVTKLALGHHREDNNETLLMNLFFSSQIKGMSPKYRSDNKKHVIIRPMISVSEEDIDNFVKYSDFPIIDNNCPFGKSHERNKMKKLLNELEKKYPNIKNTISAAQNKVILSHLKDKNLFDFSEMRSL